MSDLPRGDNISMSKCARCPRNAVFTVIEDREKIPLCLVHYELERYQAYIENTGVAM